MMWKFMSNIFTNLPSYLVTKCFLVIFFPGTDKKITNVACGSAHTVAWSTSKPIHAGRLPSKIPMEYNLLKDIPIHVIRNRLVLLHHFSELFCPSIPMFDLHEKPESGGYSMGTLAGIDALRGLLVSSGKVIYQQFLT